MRAFAHVLGTQVKDRAGKPSGGFDWYGSPPANESLTAYGLLEFTYVFITLHFVCNSLTLCICAAVT